MNTENRDEKASLIMANMRAAPLPLKTRELSKDEYKGLFPRGTEKTPLSTVKIGENQFEKMETKGRKGLVSAMYWTLKEPSVILDELRDGEESRIYIKSFRDPGSPKVIYIISVVVEIEEQFVAISTGKRKEKQVKQKIKLARRLLYEKESS